MIFSENKPLTWQQAKDYNRSRNKSIFMSVFGMAMILYFFSNYYIVMTAFAFVLLSSAIHKNKMLKYEQGKDLKISLQFTGLSFVTAIGFWAWFLFV